MFCSVSVAFAVHLLSFRAQTNYLSAVAILHVGLSDSVLSSLRQIKLILYHVYSYLSADLQPHGATG